MVRLVASPEAEADVDEILDWLEREAGKPVALKYAERFQDGFVRLMTFPEIGARRRRLHADMRIWPVAPYVIFYRFTYEDQEVRVIRVLHGRRDVNKRLFGR